MLRSSTPVRTCIALCTRCPAHNPAAVGRGQTSGRPRAHVRPPAHLGPGCRRGTTSSWRRRAWRWRCRARAAAGPCWQSRAGPPRRPGSAARTLRPGVEWDDVVVQKPDMTTGTMLACLCLPCHPESKAADLAPFRAGPWLTHGCATGRQVQRRQGFGRNRQQPARLVLLRPRRHAHARGSMR